MFRALSLFTLINLLLIQTINSSGQKDIIDSLEVVVNNDRLADVDKIMPLARLGIMYSTSTNEPEKGLLYIKKAVSLSKLQKDTKYAVYSYSQLASLYSQTDSVIQAYAAVDTCMQFLDNTTDIDIKSTALISLARAKLIFGDHNGVLELLLEAYDLQKDDKTGAKLSPVYYMLYVYYSSMDMEKMNEYAELSLVEALKSKDPKFICDSWSAVGAVRFMSSDASDKAARDSAKYACRQAVQTYEDSKSEAEYVSCAISMANLSGMFSEERNENGKLFFPDSVLYYSRKLESLAYEMNDTQLIAYVVQQISDIQLEEGQHKLAEQTLIEGLNSIETRNGFYGEKKILNNAAYRFYKHKGDFQTALSFLEKEMKYLSQIKEQQYIREGKITEAKYRLKENTEQLGASQQQAKLERKIFIGGIALAFIIIAILFLFYRMRLKNSKQKLELNLKEKEEIRLHAQLKEEELKSIELEKRAIELEKELEINRLQSELIAGMSQLSKKNDTLEKIKEQVEMDKQLVKDDIKVLLSTDRMADKSFDNFSGLIQNVHPDFFSKLQRKAQNKLTSLDLKYCTYILMDFSSKEIANILHVEPKTARSTKYRLKQKLQLGKDEDLTLFIKELMK